jgi:hypothetical protein
MRARRGALFLPPAGRALLMVLRQLSHCRAESEPSIELCGTRRMDVERRNLAPKVLLCRSRGRRQQARARISRLRPTRRAWYVAGQLIQTVLESPRAGGRREPRREATVMPAGLLRDA